jgi:hypothetical protein
MIHKRIQAPMLCDLVLMSEQRLSEQAIASLTQHRQHDDTNVRVIMRAVGDNGNQPNPNHQSGTDMSGPSGQQSSLDSHVLLSFLHPTKSQTALFGTDAFRTARREASVMSTDGNKVSKQSQAASFMLLFFHFGSVICHRCGLPAIYPGSHYRVCQACVFEQCRCCSH